ncbi:hypothetical protein [Solimonas terrae]|uniref:Uncharacterized protein n=1 Tax=Solimonas terrae TaxID=1396819 RepID=A0A6M2BT19_9GAMM|nr:hypothetical protein [Solimonas terrae]NGY05618.1 hypothetical protein [Solimonas terrae]
MPKRDGVFRSTYSLPPDIGERIDGLRKRAARHDALLNNSEIIRAGIAALEEATDSHFKQLAKSVVRLTPGPAPKRRTAMRKSGS